MFVCRASRGALPWPAERPAYTNTPPSDTVVSVRSVSSVASDRTSLCISVCFVALWCTLPALHATAYCTSAASLSTVFQLREVPRAPSFLSTRPNALELPTPSGKTM